MAYHPRQNWDPATRRQRVFTRRDFLQRAAILGVALPALPSFLAACARRDAEDGVEWAIGTPQSPVQQPLFEDNQAIASGLEPEPGPLRLYNWADYINPELIPAAEDALGVSIETTNFLNEEEALGRLAAGDVSYDVWFPTSQRIAVAVAGNLIQPINLDYIPNLEEYIWPELVDPYYDQGSRYSVPYVLYTAGIAWRTDMVDSEDIEGQTNPWDVFWNPKYRGTMGLLDSFTDTIAMALFRNGVNDPSQATEAELEAAGDSLVELVELMDVRYTIDGSYSGIPEGRFGLHHAWAGDMVNSQYYWPNEDDVELTRYLWPAKAEGSTAHGPISNDTMAVAKNATNPVLAHKFLDLMLGEEFAYLNFEWVGYQPPQVSMTPEALIEDEWVAEYLESSIMEPADFELPRAWVQGPLQSEDERLWSDQWDRAQAGG